MAASDFNGDGKLEIRTTPGPGRTVDVRGWDLAGNLLTGFAPFGQTLAGANIGAARF